MTTGLTDRELAELREYATDFTRKHGVQSPTGSLLDMIDALRADRDALADTLITGVLSDEAREVLSRVTHRAPHEEGEPEEIGVHDSPEHSARVREIAAEHGFPLSDWQPRGDAPPALTLRICPVCDRDDRRGTLGVRWHYDRSGVCPGRPVAFEYVLRAVSHREAGTDG